MTNTEIIRNWKWNKEELAALETIGYEKIVEKIADLDDRIFEKVLDYFDKWISREAPKTRLNYWMKKAGLTEAELNIWMTI